MIIIGICSLHHRHFVLLLDLSMIDASDKRLHGLCVKSEGNICGFIFHFLLIWNRKHAILIWFFLNLLIHRWVNDRRWLLKRAVLLSLFWLWISLLSGIIIFDTNLHAFSLVVQLFSVFFFQRTRLIIVVVFAWRATNTHFF